METVSALTEAIYMKPGLRSLLCLVALCLPALPLRADLEQDRVQALQPGLKQGVCEFLPVGQRKVLAIHTPAVIRPERGTLLILHDAGLHADWPGLIHRLRTRFPEKRWATLSLQLPVLPADATDDAYLKQATDIRARIAAALAWLRERSRKPVVLVAQGLMAVPATALVADQQRAVEGLVLLSPRAPDDQRAAWLNQLAQVKEPVLDLAPDTPAYASATDLVRRRNLMRASLTPVKDGLPPQPRYRLVTLAGANASFQGQVDLVLLRLRGWLHSIMEKRIFAPRRP